jgi:hypothetical protein
LGGDTDSLKNACWVVLKNGTRIYISLVNSKEPESMIERENQAARQTNQRNGSATALIQQKQLKNKSLLVSTREETDLLVWVSYIPIIWT